MSHSNGKIVPPIRTTLHDSDNKDSEEKEGRERREGEKERNRRILKYLRFVLKRMRGRHDLDPFNYALHWPPSVKAGAVCSPVLVSSGVSTIHLIKPQ